MTGVSLAGTQLRVNEYAMQDHEWNDVKVILYFRIFRGKIFLVLLFYISFNIIIIVIINESLIPFLSYWAFSLFNRKLFLPVNY